jgi:hypothetical protein
MLLGKRESYGNIVFDKMNGGTQHVKVEKHCPKTWLWMKVNICTDT